MSITELTLLIMGIVEFIKKLDIQGAPIAASTNATRVFFDTAWTSMTLLARLGRNNPMVRTQYFSEEVDAGGGMFLKDRQALMQGSHLPQIAPGAGFFPRQGLPWQGDPLRVHLQVQE